jgi:hypothetical protein
MNGYSINDQIACIVERNKSTPVKQYHNYKNSFLKPTDNQLLNEINNNLLNPKQPTPPVDKPEQVFSQYDATENIEEQKKIRKESDDIKEQKRRENEEISKLKTEKDVLDSLKVGNKDFTDHLTNVWQAHYGINKKRQIQKLPLEPKKMKKSLGRSFRSYFEKEDAFAPLRVPAEKEIGSDKRTKTEKSVNIGANEVIAKANQAKADKVNKLLDRIIAEGQRHNFDFKKKKQSNINKESRNFQNDIIRIDTKMSDDVKEAYKKEIKAFKERTKRIKGENIVKKAMLNVPKKKNLREDL